jgi:CubicO group peptidase (beta-lactamase class C family)
MDGLTLSRRAFLAGAAAVAAPTLGWTAPPAGGCQTGGGANPVGSQVEQRVSRFLAEYSAPGITFALGRNGGIDAIGAYGVADPATGEPMTPDHRMRIASVAKPITAAAIMMLAERGRIRLDQRVFGPQGLLGGWFPVDNGHPRADWLTAVTVDHLLAHTAGGWANDGNDPMFRYPQYGHADLIAATLREAPLLNPPGSSHAYSNFGYCLLGRVVEAASGQSYAQFAQSQLLAPSGATRMEIAGNTRGERRAGEAVYLDQSGEDPYALNVARMDSHGGWIGTAADLVRFGQRINGDDPVPDLIGPQSVALMRSPSGGSQGYGRGWAINPAHQNRWHAGSLPGTTSMLVLVAGGGAFAGLVNSRSRGPRETGAGLEQLLWDVYTLAYG